MIVIKLSSAGIQKILKKGLFFKSDTKPRILMNIGINIKVLSKHFILKNIMVNVTNLPSEDVKLENKLKHPY